MSRMSDRGAALRNTRRPERENPAAAVRVIFVTGDIADPDTQAFLDRSARPVLLKPFQIEALGVALARVLRARRRTG